MKITRQSTVDSLASTNTHMKENLDAFQNGDALRAITQTKGRGRRGNPWHTTGGRNLTFSFMIRSDKNISNRLFIGVALALCEIFDQFGINASIKLPNDIYVEDEKIAGMLIETVTKGNQIYHICGVGININEKNPKKYDEKATSLYKLTQKYVILEPLFDTFVSVYNQQVDQKNVFANFKEKLLERRQYTKYLENLYFLTDITPSFTCTIENHKDSLNIPCFKLKFFYL